MPPFVVRSITPALPTTIPVSLLVKKTPSNVFDTPLVCANQPWAGDSFVKNSVIPVQRIVRKEILFIWPPMVSWSTGAQIVGNRVDPHNRVLGFELGEMSSRRVIASPINTAMDTESVSGAARLAERSMSK